MKGDVTKIKSIRVNKFRGIEEARVNFGERVTVVCGKNGTSKSTILGIVAQAFSFRKDYTKNPPFDLAGKFHTLSGERFESNFSDHFRISETFDRPGSMDIGITIYDGAEKKVLDNLSLGLYGYKDRPKPRVVMRGNSTINGASSSRNVTHPVIYLSLKRLMPIPMREKYIEKKLDYLSDNIEEFIRLNQKLLLKRNSSRATATTGTINSAVAHGDNYDKESVSVGEDNVGQIVKALLSFKKLKEEYQDYHGGILLIDEADAGLFPAAQISFIDLLTRKCKELDLQVIITSHSPTLIERVHDLSKKDPENYKTVYLTDTYGKIEAKENLSWVDIYHDLMVKAIAVKVNQEEYLPKVNIYFEDKEAFIFFRSIVRKQKLLRVCSLLKDISLGCEEYKKLLAVKVPEFAQNSVVVFDADVDGVEKYKNVVKLPGHLPPDQLLFEFLYNLPSGDKFWRNSLNFTKPVFMNGAAEKVLDKLSIVDDGAELDLAEKIEEVKVLGRFQKGEARELFKNFQKHDDIQSILNARVVQRPFVRWCECNQKSSQEFVDDYVKAIVHCMRVGYGVDSGIISAYFNEI